MIVLSEIVSETVQADGRAYVRERHLDDKGKEYIFEPLLTPDVDRNAMLAARAAELNKQLASREAAAAAVSGTTLPISKLAFLKRFTLAERIAIRASADPVVQDITKMLDLADYVTPNDGSSVAGLNYLESTGLLAAGRAAEIGSA